ncbi:hypothetical protein BDM02DRAFT_3151454 [Thelephora ganbajun]|uniref:Uncharacterized protein n=1 Tax=Thelephora ganbajun TaxID=370292 RepID=A0ACB6Z2B7_THEGA|nr:hypothetical protein BDM02DRAFT_3151454 [Thelephora ganbajun]
MLWNLARCTCTRRATASLTFGSFLPTVHASRRLYATRVNEDIINLLNKCVEEERVSPTKNAYKIRSFRAAAVAIGKLDSQVQRGDELKGVRGVGPGIRRRISTFLGNEEKPPKKSDEILKRSKTIKTLMTIPGLGKKAAEALYDAGCDSIERIHLKKYKEALSPGARRGLKYIKHLESPVPRENAEAIVEFCKHFMPMDGYEIVIAGDYRRGAPAISVPIELLIADKSTTDPIPAPPHPSTLKPPNSHRPTRTKLPFSQYYMANQEKATSVLLKKIIRPLEDMGVVSDTTTPGVNVWQGWMRVPKKSESWESRKERLDGIQRLDGDFHRVNVTYIPRQSRGAVLLALTGDEDYYLDCKRKAVGAGLYLNEWGLWEWEPDSQSLSRFQTSDAPHEKTSLGAMWGSETEADKGRWVPLESFEEEQILNAIGGEYVPPGKRNFRFIVGKTKPRRNAVSMKNP